MKETLTKISKDHPVNTTRMIILRGNLEKELNGVKTTTPTAYTKIKKEFGLTGSRKKVLREFTIIIEERIHGTS